MEKKKINLGDAAVGAGKLAAGLFSKAKDAVVNAVDQNGDGKLGLDDVSIVTDSVKAAVKEGSDRWNEKQEQRRREKEWEELKPIFIDDLDGADFTLSKLIRVTDRDKKHEESELCQGSIGFYSETKDLRFLNIYRENTGLFGISLYPSIDNGLYYADPADRDHYIALDSYFTYLKMARSNELQQIAQKLGAKHFRVTLMEEIKESSSNKLHTKAGVKVPAKQGAAVDVNHETTSGTYQKLGIAAEMDCPGHEPERPNLVYLQKDLNVQNLINMRLAKNALTHQKVTVSFTQSSGIKVRDAMKIDAAINTLKLETNTSVTSEAEKETRRIFEYEIDF